MCTAFQATPSCLVGVNEACEVVEGSGLAQIESSVIHKGIHARPDAACVFHLHPPYATALGNNYQYFRFL